MTIYRYTWGNNAKRATLKGRRCILLATGALGSVKVQFLDNGQEEIVSRRALRRVEEVLA